jgi:hypothetical protein
MTDGYAYIDGFNLFHGLEDAGLKQYYWLDMNKIANKILSQFGHSAELTRYYTTRLVSTHRQFETQRLWLSAVEALRPAVKMEWGMFQPESRECPYCGAKITFPREKKTDVNLGIQALEDVVTVGPSAVLLITGDSDQVPTVAALKRRDNQYPVFIAFPPRRHCNHLSDLAGRKHTVDITAELLRGCCLPDVVNGYVHRPADWQ